MEHEDDLYKKCIELESHIKDMRENMDFLYKKSTDLQSQLADILKTKIKRTDMNAKEFLESKGISKPTYEGVRLVDDKEGYYRIIELLDEFKNLHTSNKKKKGNSKMVIREF